MINMHSNDYYPKILLIAIGKINYIDAANNGMLIRNLLGDWPRSKLCQIYSSGDNTDIGFFEKYYKLGKGDRRFGGLFLRFKKKQTSEKITYKSDCKSGYFTSNFFSGIKTIIKNSGIHEFVFKIKISKEMDDWILTNCPDVIVCQGYNIAFASLPILIKKKYNIPYIWYPTDDWPKTLYQEYSIRIPLLSQLVKAAVTRLVEKLVHNSSANVAFNHYMAYEYFCRWGKEFNILMQGDFLSRFVCSVSSNLDNSKVKIVAAGVFDSHRLPLLFDLDAACELLLADGIVANPLIYAVNDSEINTNDFKHLTISKVPNHDALPSCLMNSDILFLPERFDSTSKDIGLSISSKAHLYMYSQVPIIVYSDALTGISKYASEFRWALVVKNRSVLNLKDAIVYLQRNKPFALELSNNAMKTAKEHHDIKSIRHQFSNIVSRVIKTNPS